MRTWVVAGAIVLALLAPAETLGAPTRGIRVAPVPQLPPSRAAFGRSAGQDSFRVPFHVDARPKPIESNTEPAFRPYRWNAWPLAPHYVLSQPAWYQNGCFANNIFGAPSTFQSGASLPTGVTLGSLVDGHSKNLISPTPSYNPTSPSNGEGATGSNPLGLQYHVQATTCGSSTLIDL